MRLPDLINNPVVTLVLSLVPLASITVWLLWRWSVREQMRLPRCGSCGYDVRHIIALSCPECGLDLRQAGIVAPGQAPRLSAMWAALMWLTLYPIPAMVVGYIIVNTFVPWTYQMSVTRPIRTAAPYAVTTLYARLDGTTWHTRRSRPHDTVGQEMSSLRIGSDMQRAGPTDLRIDLKSGRYSYTHNGVLIQGDGGLKPAMLQRWLIDSGTFKPDEYPAMASEQMSVFIAEQNTELGRRTGRQYANPANPADTSSSLVPAPPGTNRFFWAPPAFMTAGSVTAFIDEVPSPRKQTAIIAIWIGLWLLSGWAVYLRATRSIANSPAASAAALDGPLSPASAPAAAAASPTALPASQHSNV